MSGPEHASLHDEIAAINARLADFRLDDSCRPSVDAGRWLRQFHADERPALVRTVRRWLQRYYLSKEEVVNALRLLGGHIERQSGGLDGVALADIDGPSGGQARINRIFQQLHPEVSIGRTGTTTRWLYLDDCLATGRTLSGNLDRLPALRGRSIMFHLFAHTMDRQRLKDRCIRMGMQWLVGTELENRRSSVQGLDVIRPSRAAVTTPVRHYMRLHGHIGNHAAFSDPELFDDHRLYEAAEDRQVVERALLRAGAGIAQSSRAIDRSLRPLGYVRAQSWSLGFGAVAFTYQNAPNVLPLAMWWGVGDWFPLVTRRVIPCPPASRQET